MTTPLNPRIWLGFGALNGFLAVVMGALGSHSFVMSASGAETFATATDYQIWHGLALIAVGAWQNHLPARGLQIAGWLFLLGIALFCVPLYAIAISGDRALAHLAPIGGTLLMGGWLALGITAIRSRAS